ncbi:MAG: DUF3341 domain-containing protein [Acetobacteraceae bacterium]
MTGIVAAFATEPALEHALARLRADRIGEIETYTPKALEADKEGTGSPLPLMIFVAGIISAAAMFALETYADVVNWPVNVGGRPAFSWPAFVPIAFEFGILCAMTTGIVGYLAINRLPRLWEPIDECDAMREAMRAEWVVAVRNDDRREIERARRILLSLHPLSIEAISPALVEIPA